MDNQNHLSAVLEPFPSQEASERGHMSANTMSNQQADESQAQLPRTGMTNDGSLIQETVVLINHRSDRYVWPFELCTSYHGIKPLLEEMYTLLNEPNHVQDIHEGKYEIQTQNGDIILPSVWANFVRPGSTIRLSFPLSPGLVRRLREQTEIEIIRPNSPRLRYEDTKEIDYDRPATPSILPPSPVRRSTEHSTVDDHNSEDEGEDDIDSQSTTEAGSELPEPAKSPEPIREVVVPVDTEGNRITFEIYTAPSRRPARTTNVSTTNGNVPKAGGKTDVPETQAETLRITKASSAEAESRNVIQVHTLPGPENVHLRESVKITWYHIPAARLDFNRFKNVCLTLPGLSDRMQILVQAMVKKIEEHKIKVFLGGLFIEPGTVLRADEKEQPDPQSVIFSCVPYLDIQPLPPRTSTDTDDRLFPPRTLMQSYYPYEPTRERDQEQAITIFNDDHAGKIINVPNLWIMNIGSDFVVSCGHKPLAQNLVKSIEVVPEDLEQLTNKSITPSSITNIRLTDWDGRLLLFSLNDSRTYFQLEQKIRELRFMAGGNFRNRTLKMVQTTPSGVRKVEPGDWSSIIRRTDLIFIDLALEDKAEEEQTVDSAAKDFSNIVNAPNTSLVPPFFRWPFQTDTEAPADDKGNIDSVPPNGVHDSTYCLENAERVMLSQTLDSYQTVNQVDGAFTSTEFYQGLPEDTWQHIEAQFPSLKYDADRRHEIRSYRTHHEFVVNTQRSSIGERTVTFLETVHATLRLFVNDVDKSVLLRKVWGAMFCIYQMVTTIEACGPEQTHQKPPDTAKRQWYIRSDVKNPYIQAPEADERLKRFIRRCQRCQSLEPFDSQDGALEHLEKHVEILNQRKETAAAAITTPLTSSQPIISSKPEPNLKEWVVTYEQAKAEQANAGTLAIFVLGCKTAEDLFFRAKELAEGVEDEDGKMSEIYSLPRSLVDAFREMIVFYLAIERALHFTQEQYRKDTLLDGIRNDPFSTPFSDAGLDVLKRFGEGARRSLFMARAELCRMVASPEPLDIFHHLCLGPEYVCAWLMRRLIVKPLEDRLTAGDMYRAYLSTMQFQVNHRPSKRLLRSINLVQEELRVLNKVNTWQDRLIQNYSQVLDDATYGNDIPFRRAMFPYERSLLRSCLDNVNTAREEYNESIRRCTPLSDSTKQALEITEEDHGKAIMVFTTVTVIFLPLSFVTSYLGMNTIDIRNMNNQQTLFWIIALPLTFVTMALCVFISYKGSSIQDQLSSLYRAATGKEDQDISARGISVAQRKRASILQSNTSSDINNAVLVDEAEYASPQPDPGFEEFTRRATMGTYAPETVKAVEYSSLEPEPISTRRLPQSRLVQPINFTKKISVPVQDSLQVDYQRADYQRPTYVRIEKRFLEEETLLAFDYPYETDPSDPSFWLITRNLNDLEKREIFEHTEQLRSRNRRRYETPIIQERINVIPERRRIVVPASRMNMAMQEMYEPEGGEGDRLPGYTWHKKRRGRPSGRGMSRRMEMGDGEFHGNFRDRREHWER